jgi:hypothetical protein
MEIRVKNRWLAKPPAVLLAVALILGLSSFAWAARTHGPAIFIPQPTYNAGKIVEGKILTHTFVIKNRGTQDLVIRNVKPG